MNLNDVIDHIPDPDRIIAASTLISDYQEMGYSLDTPLEEFVTDSSNLFLFTSFVSAQKKAKTIENYIAAIIGGSTIPANDEHGDVIIDTPYVIDNELFQVGDFIELKVSTTNDKQNINARQLRLWQDIDYYILGYVEEDNIEESLFYVLDHDDMVDICTDYAGSTHGTGAVAAQNEFVELSLTIPVYSNSAIGEALEPFFCRPLTDLIINAR